VASYVGSHEIHDYLSAVVQKHDVGKFIHLNHKLTSAVWSETRGEWDIEVDVFSPGQTTQTIKRSCNILINASGFLNNWKWPDLPGLNDFKGTLLHSASWKETQQLSGDTVAVIGAGSSGIQIVPALQPIVSKLYAFIRSPTWIAPSQGFVDPTDGSGGLQNFFYTTEQKQHFRDNPDAFLEYRKNIESNLNRIIEIFIRDSPGQLGAKQLFANVMKDRLGGNDELAEKLIPKHGVGCRRLTPGPGFLEALVKPNVEVVTSEIDCVMPEGLLTKDGIFHKVNTIVCATGFDTTFRPRFRLIGRDDASLAERWKDTEDVEAYLALAIPDFPNYFSEHGPSVISSLKC
jgi:cation diffusion facilitator CzcD-associated flavoprotein CzcO